MTSRISTLPRPLSGASGATVTGPTPTTDERSSRKLLPTIRPPDSATTE
jgi:hypothetical protein